MSVNAQIQKLWQEHLSSPFPRGYGGKEVNGIILAELDGAIAGCIHTFINADGQLDPRRIQILKKCSAHLVAVTQKLDGDALNFFVQLETLANLVCEEIGNTTNQV